MRKPVSLNFAWAVNDVLAMAAAIVTVFIAEPGEHTVFFMCDMFGRRRVMCGEVYTGSHPGKNVIGILPLQLRAHRAIADQYQFQFRVVGPYGLEGAQHQRQILFRRNASHVNDRHLAIRNHTLLQTQFLAALVRVEQRGIH